LSITPGQRDRPWLHQIPGHGPNGRVVDVTCGEPGDGRRDILHCDRLEQCRSLFRRQIERKSGQRPNQRAATIGVWRDHKPWSQDRVRRARCRDQPLGLALAGRKGGVILMGIARDGDVNQADRTPALLDGCEQARDEIAMHDTRIAARTILQHTQAIDDRTGGMIADQPCQIG
jgi:hypothetical protein